MVKLNTIFKSYKKQKRKDISYSVFDQVTDEILSKIGRSAREKLEKIPATKRKKLYIF